MQMLGLSPGTQLLEACRLNASEEMADALQIVVDDPVVQLRRLRLGKGLPIGIQTTHLPEARVPGLYESAASIQSLYAWLKEHCAITPVKAKEVYRVGRVADRDAGFIQLPAGTPAFEVERIAYDSQGPFEYARSIMRADRYEIRSTLYI
jgi:GntR family transcriptional regulator